MRQAMRRFAVCGCSFLLALLIDCGGGHDDGGSASSPSPPSEPPVVAARLTEVSFYTENTNPLLITFRPAGGKLTTFFGEKNADGSASITRGLFFQDQESSNVRERIDLDSFGRPVHAVFASGSTLDVAWEANVTAKLVFTSADGKETSILEEDFPATAQAVNRNPTPVAKAFGDEAPLLIHVLADGDMPQTQATLWVTVRPHSITAPKSLYFIPITENPPAVYSGTYPTTPSIVPRSAVSTICGATASIVSNVCGVLEEWTTTMIDGGGCGAAPGKTGKIECIGLFAAVRLACPVIRATEPATAPICERVEKLVELFDNAGVTISASAEKWGRHGDTKEEASGQQPRAELKIYLNNRTYDAISVDSGSCKDSGGTESFSGEFVSTGQDGVFSIIVKGRRYTVNAPGSTSATLVYPEAGGITTESLNLNIADDGAMSGNGSYSGSYPQGDGTLLPCSGSYTISGSTTRFR